MLPGQRQSYGRSRRRRSHDALTAPASSMCPLSGMPKLPHRACRESGYVRPGLKLTIPKLRIGVPKD
jgi:large subunit ribosomal protein L32